MDLSVLPSTRGCSIGSQGTEAKAFSHVTLGNSGVLDSGKHLPALVLSRASHEARSTPAVEGVVAIILAGLVVEGTHGGALRDIGGVGLGEGQSAVGVNIDLLTARDHNALKGIR